MRNIVVYLIRGNDESISALEKSLSLLKENFLPWSPADILVFHEDNMKPSQLEGRTVGLPVKTALVDFSSVPPEMADVPPEKRGYRHMCHFFANDIFFRGELDGYDYYMRMDDDSFILSPLRFNVFERMRGNGYKYAYRVVLKDRPHVCVGFGDLVKDYFAAEGRELTCRLPPPYKVFYTNFEICDINWFKGKDWQDWFAAIDKAGGIWRYRWGDHIIRYYGLSNILPQSMLWCLKEMHYRHQSEWLPGWTGRTPMEAFRHYSHTAIMLLRGFFK